jgi:microcystin-dependent protein
MADGFVGEIRAFGFNFTPTGWLPCNGGVYPVQQFSALFAIIGIRFGGNGTTNFQVPDLRGKAAVGLYPGTGAFNTPGISGGTENVTITVNTMPAHNHMVEAVTRTAQPQTALATATPANNVYLSNAYCSGLSQGIIAYGNTATGGTMDPNTISPAGNGESHNNMSPYQAMTYCICTEGIFPQHP